MTPAPPHVSTDYRYAPIPEDVLYDSALDPLAVRIYGALMRHGLTPDVCYPSHRRLAELVGCAARSVQRPLRVLEDAGWIARLPRFDERGERISDAFVVHVARTSDAPYALQSAGATRSGTRKNESQVNESHTDQDLDRGSPDPAACFDEFWQVFPLRVGKGAARRAWPRALRAAGGDCERLLAGARRYRDDPNREQRYTKHPSSWLNGECWDDEPLPSRTGRQPIRQPDMDREGPSGRLEI